MQLITQSFVTYLKRVTLIALLAVLGYGIGTAFRPIDSSLQAVPTECNEEKCVNFTVDNAPDPDWKICMVDPVVVNTDKHCKNDWPKGASAHTCKVKDCGEDEGEEGE